ncbi:DUF2142 domain-containing protein [Asaia sp. As-1742]|uniref:DUF2142 domain-containing protein n=1 Tax=Asaia sp. As-1742 TaxID=2608325 RepID=UPI0014230198|nr:DUF2142 domain-containing protein [Asaia sp. As-1742]NIE79048.1 DUF2142 domain-containing protein [Asaia sp. As-1742]
MLSTLRSALALSPVRVFMFFASMMGLACILLIPPGQMPDERNHFARIVQIAQGGFVGIKLDAGQAGGYLPANFPSEAELLDSLRFHAERKVDMGELSALAQRQWDNHRSWASFGNTVIYAPITYLPGAVVTFIGRHTRATIIQTSIMVHVINAVISIALCTLAIALARRGVLYLMLLASLPMVMALNASCSQDGLIFALALLTASLLTRINTLDPGSTRFWIGIACLFAVLTVSKPPLLLCSLIPLGLFPAREWLGVGRRKYLAVAPFVASIVAFLVWQHFGMTPTKVQFLDGSGTSDSGQVHWVLTHPLSLPMLAYTTLKVNLGHNIHEFIGVLGWLDTLFPAWFYRLVYATILATLCFCAYPAIRNRALAQNGRTVFVTVLAVLLAVGAVYFSLYVIWTPVGAPIIDGVQGRYFLPIAPFLALLFPLMPRAGQLSPSESTQRWAMLGMTAFLCFDLVTLTSVLAARFW